MAHRHIHTIASILLVVHWGQCFFDCILRPPSSALMKQSIVEKGKAMQYIYGQASKEKPEQE